MSQELTFIAADESQMYAIGNTIAYGLNNRAGGMIYLVGTLGMGKTTLSRAIIQSLGWSGKVKSPTYTLVETYELGALQVSHFDLYRLADPEELEFMGIRDYQGKGQFSLVEWPEKGQGILPKADLLITLSEYKNGRKIAVKAETDQGLTLLKSMKSGDQ